MRGGAARPATILVSRPNPRPSAKDAERGVRLINLLLIKSADLGRIVPALGRADRFEINEPASRVICLLQQESRVFVRLSMSPPAQ